MNDQTANPARGEDAERAAFEAWHRSKFATKHSTGQPTRDMHNGAYAEKYGPEHQQQMWEVWQAARCAPALGAAIPSNSGELDAAGLPALPKDEFCAWLQNGVVVHAFTHGVGDPAQWDHDGHWAGKGYSRAPLYTAEQVRQAQRDAYELGRIEGRRDQHETHVTLLGQNLKLRAQLAQKGKP